MRISSLVSSIALALVPLGALPACGDAGDADQPGGGKADDVGDTGDIDDLTAPREIIAAVFDEHLRHLPHWAIFVGDRTHDAELGELDADEFDRFYARANALSGKLSGIDVAALTLPEQVAFDKAQTLLIDTLADEASRSHLWEVNTFQEPVIDFAMASSTVSVRGEADVAAIEARYAQAARYLGERRANLEAGAAQGMVASKAVIAGYLAEVRGFASGDIFKGLSFDDAVAAADRPALQARIDAAVDRDVIPAMTSYADFVEDVLLPAGRDGFGVDGVPGGADYYREQVRFQTGTELSPADIHALGLAKVAELEAEMIALLGELGISAPTLSEGLAALATVPENVAATVATAQPYAGALVGRLVADDWSRDLWGVDGPTPPMLEISEDDGASFYLLGSSTLFINLSHEPLYALDGQVVHELTHYLQDVVGAEIAEQAVSPFEPLFGSYSLVEGAGLYSERVALDRDFYRDGDARLSALRRINAASLVMLRAVRLVVDTGIHSQGWTRDEVIRYMTDRVIGSPEFIAGEADRYAGWPGQALAYMVGSEAILAEKARAEAALGTAFDGRAFHRVVLELNSATPAALAISVDRMIEDAD